MLKALTRITFSSKPSHLKHFFLAAFLLFQTCISLLSQLTPTAYSSFQQQHPHSLYFPSDLAAPWGRKKCFLYHSFSCLSSSVFFLHAWKPTRIYKSQFTEALKPYSRKHILHLSEVLTTFLLNYANFDCTGLKHSWQYLLSDLQRQLSIYQIFTNDT